MSIAFEGVDRDGPVRHSPGVARDDLVLSGVSPQSGLAMRWGEMGPFAPEKPGAHYAWAKRTFDIALSAAGLMLLVPLFVLVALAIKSTSRGPVFFTQSREGRNGVPFRLVKFRSLRVEDTDHSGIAQTKRCDPRITAIGRFIRKTSIDELPQLWNVLIGDMSIVGPRPHVKDMHAAGSDYRSVVPYYDLRLAVAPGITGWAQANGYRGPTDNALLARSRVNHDVAYIQNMSFGLDLRIVWMTVKSELLGGTGL